MIGNMHKYAQVTDPRSVQSVDEKFLNASFEVLRTRDPKWLERGQRLRYQNFFSHREDALDEDHPDAVDRDEFDQHCDHLIVLDNNNLDKGMPKVVGTYRMRLFDLHSCRENNTSFYTATEFNLDKLMKKQGKVLELGRSCVRSGYRDGTVIRYLWRGLGDFLSEHHVDYILGCVSFPEARADLHLNSIAYLYQNYLMEPELRPLALHAVSAKMGDLPIIDKSDYKSAFNKLPPLLKAYLRIGARVGEGAVLDTHCNTLDLCVVANFNDLDPRYTKRFMRQ